MERKVGREREGLQDRDKAGERGRVLERRGSEMHGEGEGML